MSDKKIVLQTSGGGPPRDPVKEVIGRDRFVMLKKLDKHPKRKKHFYFGGN